MPLDPRRRRDALLKRYQVAFDRYQSANTAIWKKYLATANTPTRKEWQTVSRALATLKTIQEKIAEIDCRLEKPAKRR
jgi:hypothetical protein